MKGEILRKMEACLLQTVSTAVPAPRILHEATGGRQGALAV